MWLKYVFLAVRNTTDNFTYVTVHAKVWRQRERGGEKLLRCVCVWQVWIEGGKQRTVYSAYTETDSWRSYGGEGYYIKFLTNTSALNATTTENSTSTPSIQSHHRWQFPWLKFECEIASSGQRLQSKTHDFSIEINNCGLFWIVSTITTIGELTKKLVTDY